MISLVFSNINDSLIIPIAETLLKEFPGVSSSRSSFLFWLQGSWTRCQGRGSEPLPSCWPAATSHSLSCPRPASVPSCWLRLHARWRRWGTSARATTANRWLSSWVGAQPSPPPNTSPALSPDFLHVAKGIGEKKMQGKRRGREKEKKKKKKPTKNHNTMDLLSNSFLIMLWRSYFSSPSVTELFLQQIW